MPYLAVNTFTINVTNSHSFSIMETTHIREASSAPSAPKHSRTMGQSFNWTSHNSKPLYVPTVFLLQNNCIYASSTPDRSANLCFSVMIIVEEIKAPYAACVSVISCGVEPLLVMDYTLMHSSACALWVFPP